jgi:FlaA1/EpsC-like NDP-sugar epimerase
MPLRTLAVMLYDICVVVLAFYFSIVFTQGQLFPETFPDLLQTVKLFAVVVAVQFSIFYFVGAYKAMWRFSSIPDLIRIVKAASLAVPLSYVCIFLLNRLDTIPRTSVVLDWMLLLLGLNAGRLTYRMMKDRAVLQFKQMSSEAQKRTFIIGAGVAGERLLRETSQNSSLQLTVVGLIDDDPKKIGKSIRGVNVNGPIANLPQMIVDQDVQQIVIAMPSAPQEKIREISKICREMGRDIQLKILPRMADILDGKQQAVRSLRNIEPGDLLGRKAHDLDVRQMSAMIKNKVVLVTGAGGSIGSELCKQIAHLQPKTLVLFELTELFLYELENSLRELFPTLDIQSVVGDIRNFKKLDCIFEKYRPDVVFHSAAYKHVPLMQLNPWEAIQTNIAGTFNVATVAEKYKASRFVLISTDKAINPTNIMGATKRVAELVCQNAQVLDSTKFIMVRFGNVLGSSGSVVPLFKKQIEKGGPVTVTHPEMRRYFMSIPEAIQLVIQAGSLGNHGEVMVLDMGEPVKIKDLAYEMIALSGLKPEVDIKIEYTGLRPGEKLFEELFHEEETILPTKHPLVKIAKARLPQAGFNKDLSDLISLPEGSSLLVISQAIKKLVPEYCDNANGIPAEKIDLIH